MRLLINSMTGVLALVIILTTVWYHRTKEQQQQNMLTVQLSLEEFEEHLAYEAAIWQSENEQAGMYPPQVQPGWFEQGLPSNPLLNNERPWIDIAPAEDYSEHPPDPLVDVSGQAAFWYNPNNGIVRARVPRQASDRLTLKLYNEANYTDLSELPWSTDPDRAPLAFNPNPVTSGLHASPAKSTTGLVTTAKPEPSDKVDSAEDTPWYKKRTVEQATEEVMTQAEPEADPDRPSLRAE